MKPSYKDFRANSSERTLGLSFLGEDNEGVRVVLGFRDTLNLIAFISAMQAKIGAAQRRMLGELGAYGEQKGEDNDNA